MQIDSQHGPAVANLTIRKLDTRIKERLRVRAAEHGHSMEEEARRILGEVLTDAPPATDGFERMRRHFAEIGGVDLDLPPREPGREPPRFE